MVTSSISTNMTTIRALNSHTLLINNQIDWSGLTQKPEIQNREMAQVNEKGGIYCAITGFFQILLNKCNNERLVFSHY